MNVVPVLVVPLDPSFTKTREFGSPSACPPSPASNQAAVPPSNRTADGVAEFSVTTSALKPVSARGTAAARRLGDPNVDQASSATPNNPSSPYVVRKRENIRFLPCYGTMVLPLAVRMART